MSKGVKIGIGCLAVVVVLCAVVLLMPKEEGQIARITQDGQVVAEIDLSELTGPYTFPVDGEDHQWNGIVAEKGRIRVLEASCPDQVCVNQGWISDSTLPIVCLPNKLVIEIVGGESELDAVTK